MKIKHLPKRLVQLGLAPFGLQIRRKTGRSSNSMLAALEHISGLGFRPGTVIDVGAARGTVPLYSVFPSSRHILLEPLEEYRPSLDELTRKLPNAEWIVAAAAPKSGSVTINVHPDLDGSSLYLEDEDSDVNGVPRVVPAVTLDELCEERELEGPYLIKVDVQGAELDVLQGSANTLDDTEYVILETALFQFFVGGPLLFDVIEFMQEKGFVAYDMFDPIYRPLDDALSQIDVAFVKESGLFREYHSYATREQRKAQNRRFGAGCRDRW